MCERWLALAAVAIAMISRNTAAQDEPPTGPDLLAACGVREPSAFPYPAEAELPGVPLPAPRLEATLQWPARPNVDDAGDIRTPEGHSVLASLPVIRPNGDTAGWLAIVVPGLPATMEEWSANPGLRAMWFPTGGEPAEIFAMDSTWLEPLAQRWGRIRVEGDRLAMICLPSYEGHEGLDVWVEGRCLTFLDYLGTESAGGRLGALWPGFEYHEDLTLRDVDGDGSGELFRGRARVENVPSSELLEPLPADRQPLWAQARMRLAVRYSDPAAERAGLEGAHEQLTALLSAIYPNELPDASACVDRAIAERLVWLAAQRDEDVWAYIQERLQPRVHRAAVLRMGVLPANRLDWPMPARETVATPSIARWDGEDRVVFGVTGETLQTCDASGCLTGETVTAPPLDLSPDGASRFRCLAGYEWGWTAFVFGPAGEDPAAIDPYSDPCACAWLEPNGDPRGFYVRDAAAVSPPNDEAETPCGYAGPPTYRGIGFAGWMSPDSLVWVDGPESSQVVSTTAKTAEYLETSAMPAELRPLAGLTDDGLYHYYVDNSGVAAIWRREIQTGETRMVGTISFDLETTPLESDAWGGTSLEDAASPGSYVLPSPSGRRIWLIVNGIPRGIWELAE